MLLHFDLKNQRFVANALSCPSLYSTMVYRVSLNITIPLNGLRGITKSW